MEPRSQYTPRRSASMALAMTVRKDSGAGMKLIWARGGGGDLLSLSYARRWPAGLLTEGRMRFESIWMAISVLLLGAKSLPFLPKTETISTIGRILLTRLISSNARFFT